IGGELLTGADTLFQYISSGGELFRDRVAEAAALVGANLGAINRAISGRELRKGPNVATGDPRTAYGTPTAAAPTRGNPLAGNKGPRGDTRTSRLGRVLEFHSSLASRIGGNF